jgi:hypothetical protein
MKTLSMTAVIWLMVGLLLRPQEAVAQTPDAATPSAEVTCSKLVTATPALYGLCLAYCEAQDLTPIDPEDTDTIRKSVPERRILELYNKKMRAGDPPMPCVQIPIPCWTPEEIAVVGTNIDPSFRTLRHQIYDCPDGRTGETWYIEEQAQGKQVWAGAWYRVDTGEQGCWFNDWFHGVERSFLLESQAEYKSARAAILARADELGWNPLYLWETTYSCP